jgi:hypothetical protein
VFGYRNRHVFHGEDPNGNPLYLHTVREVDKKEAAVVHRIFELYASGLGAKAIAKRLNSEGALTPKPFVRKDPTKCSPWARGIRRRFAQFCAANCIAAS